MQAAKRQNTVTAFCEECVWARAVRTHFTELFESGDTRHRLLAEIAKTFFQDLNIVLLEYVLLQQPKLTPLAQRGQRTRCMGRPASQKSEAELECRISQVASGLFAKSVARGAGVLCRNYPTAPF